MRILVVEDEPKMADVLRREQASPSTWWDGRHTGGNTP